MDQFQIIILALVQGLTEFLPVSSSAHLILVPTLLGWPDQGLAFDIAVHMGTLIAVLVYFRKDLCEMGINFFQSCMGDKLKAPGKLLWFVGFSTIPVGLAGLVMRTFDPNYFRSVEVIAFATMGFALLLGLAGKIGSDERKLNTIGWRDVLVIGLFQVLSLIPGTSRSGITLTAGLFCGFTKEAAARYSFLLSIPVILLAGGLEVVKLLKSTVTPDWSAMLIGAVVAGVSGYLCIHYFMKLLSKIGVTPFVYYRLLLGIFLLYHFYAV
jgi:undecaprenyl-diphosphatase